MKLTKKVKIAFFPSVFLPLMILLFSLLCIWKVNGTLINEIHRGIDIFISPTRAVNELTREEFNEIQINAVKDEVCFESITYLEEMNEKLLEKNSFLLVRKENKIAFCGVKKLDDKFISMLPKFGATSSDIDGGLFVDSPKPYLIKQQDFHYSDDSEGTIFIVTDVSSVLPKAKVIFFRLVFLIAAVVLFSSTILSYMIYHEILTPLKVLKEATQRIKEGDLDTPIKTNRCDEIVEVFDSFDEMRIKLKETVDLKLKYEQDNRELISNISHDLKTPITAIKGYIEGIKDGVADTPEKMEKYIRIIYNKATEMDGLINELALYTQLDHSSIPYNFIKINVEEYFKDCVDEISADLDNHKIGFTFLNYSDKDCNIIIDPEQMKRVINNLISNAVKYNDKEKGQITMRIEEREDTLLIAIEDNGKGIAPKDLPHVFDRTYRGDASRNSTQGGSGLGLSIAKKIIEEHGGTIWATSKEEVGTTISFEIRKVKGEQDSE